MKILLSKFLLTSVLLYIVSINIDFETLLSSLARADFSLILLAVFLYVLTFVVGGFRWFIINRELNISISIRDCVRIFFVGGFFSQFLVGGGYGGDIYRVWALGSHTDKQLLSVVSVFIDRTSGLVSVVFVILCFIPAYLLSYKEHLHVIGLIGLLSFGLMMLFISIAYLGRISVLQRISDRFNILHFSNAQRFAANFGRSLSSWPSTGFHLSWSVAALFLNIFALVAIGAALDIRVDSSDVILLTPLVFLAKSLPFSLAGWGAREAAMVYFFGFVNVNNSNAVAMSLMSGILVLIAASPGGFIWVLEKHNRHKSAIDKRQHIC